MDIIKDLQSLAGANVAAPDTTNAPVQDAPPTQGASQAPGGGVDIAQKWPFFRDMAVGKIPGVYIPAGYKNALGQGITPDLVTKLGFGIYRSMDKSIAGAFFNPKTVSVKEMQKLDKEGKLTEALPPISTYYDAMQGSKPQTASDNTPDSAQAAPDASPSPTAPSTAPVPVMPPPAAPSAQRQIAAARLKNTAPQIPTNRQVPGGGTVLNGLLARPV